MYNTNLFCDVCEKEISEENLSSSIINPSKIICNKCNMGNNKGIGYQEWGRQFERAGHIEQVPAAPKPRNIIDQCGDFSKPSYTSTSTAKRKAKKDTRIFLIQYVPSMGQAVVEFNINRKRSITKKEMCQMADVPYNAANAMYLNKWFCGYDDLFIDLYLSPLERKTGININRTDSKRILFEGMRHNKKVFMTIATELKKHHYANRDKISPSLIERINPEPILPF